MSLVAILAAISLAWRAVVAKIAGELCGPSAVPWTEPMGIIVPNILEVADIPHLAALVAPRKMTIASGMDTAGQRPGHVGCSRVFRSQGRSTRCWARPGPVLRLG